MQVNDPDRGLVEAVRAGDHRRFADLVDRHKDRALTLAVRLLGHRQEAEEAVQDSFVRAFRGLETFRGESLFATWLYRIVYNVCSTRLARRRQGAEVSIEEEEAAGTSVLADVLSPSALDRMEQEELSRMLVEEVERLPDRYRAPITLFYLQELEYADIARILDQPLGTVKVNLFRGRLVLRERVRARMRSEVTV